MTGQFLDIASPSPEPFCSVADCRRETSRFLGVHFACCDAYSRVYANRARTAYIGHCPRCAKRIEFAIAPGGTEARFFTAG
jgi:hypothetical protein